MNVSAAIGLVIRSKSLYNMLKSSGADCIFTGETRFSTPIERFLGGSVLAAVAARALFGGDWSAPDSERRTISNDRED